MSRTRRPEKFDPPRTSNVSRHHESPTRISHGKWRWLALVALSLAQLMDVLDNTIVNIALPSAQSDLAFSADNRQWLVTRRQSLSPPP
ncbi:MFS transporter [Pandoraea sp. NPDC087047]|uniref:MFS transporter n=1 Tax=Pandoraea sp. NPDC087047 TaxID=3364390 RepID=UPI0037F65FEA